MQIYTRLVGLYLKYSIYIIEAYRLKRCFTCVISKVLNLIIQCARNGEIEGLKTLLADPDKLANVNELDETGTSALHYAVRSNNYELAELLLKDGKASRWKFMHGLVD